MHEKLIRLLAFVGVFELSYDQQTTIPLQIDIKTYNKYQNIS